MARRGDEAQAEPLEIVEGVVERVDLKLATVARAGVHLADGKAAPETVLRTMLTAPATNPTQALYVSADLKTGNAMVKDEDVCLHCGLCAERCPTGAWDMQKFYLEPARAQLCSR